MNTAIIVAAGRGSRFGSDTPKQFLNLLGKPVIAHTLERFERCRSINSIVLVVADEYVEKIDDLVERGSYSKLDGVVAGGRTRAESVSRGLDAAAVETKFVAVHDGARPLVTASEIDRTVAAAEGSGAACLVAEVTDTIKRVDGDRIVETVPRSVLRRALTPQAFEIELLRRALQLSDLDDTITDECMAVERLGAEIAIVEGSPRNIKITHADDLAIAEMYLGRGDID
ncbi:MAG: 2-C-methyl-D-erythritol 4-phosphate cytidylyltransferase [Pyrinomonadaceae bacterium]